MKRAIFLFAVLLCLLSSAYAENSVLFSAMKDEMARSMNELRLPGEPGPYYISYLLTDTCGLRISADSGAIIMNADNRSRALRIDLRVGSYAQDNTNFLSLSNTASLLSALTSSNIRVPLDDDYDVLRRQIWLATDRAYKNALETLTKKKAALQNTVQAEALPDFVKGGGTSSLSNENSLAVAKKQWEQWVDQVARIFIKQQGIQKSRVDLAIQIANSYYVNSEGAAGIEPQSSARLAIVATTQAEDGMPLANYRVYTAARPEDLPEKAKLDGDVKNLISELLDAKTAPLGEEYSGPVLFMNEAAGELFSQGFSNLLVAKKTPLSDSPQTNAMLGRMVENPFLSRLNMKVAANFLSMKATPTLKNYNQKPLLGAYSMDEEGVLSSDVNLIENGILKNLLSSRTPVKGVEQSNGHGRGGGATPSIIRITSSNKKSYQQLKEDLINAAKEEGLAYGYIVRGLTPASEALSGDGNTADTVLQLQQGAPEPTQFRLTKPYLIFKVYPDGKEEQVRGIDFGSISINSLKSVLATSDDETVYSFPAGSASPLSSLAGSIIRLAAGGGSGGGYTSVITPSLLINGIDLKKSTGRYPKLPILGYPAK